MAGEIEEPFRFDFQTDLLQSGSISFGRFESESLSWERRSSFSHNRYLEEVEKYSKPGSVTEKKAYFEAHFRRKALLKQNSSESQDEKESSTNENNDLHDEETKTQKCVNKNIETSCKNETLNDMVLMVDMASEANDFSLTSHTADKDNDMVIMVKATSEMKQSKLKLKAHVYDSVKAKTRENKSLHVKEKEKKAHSGKTTLKSEESSFVKAKTLPLNKSIVKEYKSLKTMETKKTLPATRQTANRNKETTTTTPSVNKPSKGFTFRSDQRAERRKEEKRAAELAQSRKSHNFKPRPMPSFYKESNRSSSYQKEEFIRPSSSPSNPPMKTSLHEKKKKELTFQPKNPKPTKGVDLVNGPKLGYLAVSLAI